MFTANGGSGYVLKPQYLRSRSHAPSPTSKSSFQSPSIKKERKEKLPSATPGLEQEKHEGGDGDDKTGKEEGVDDQVDEDREDGNGDDEEEREEKEEEELMSPPQLEERMKITILSGQTIQAPKRGQGDDSTPVTTADVGGDVVDPYVEVKIFGEPNNKQKFKTKHIKNNGKRPYEWVFQ